MLLHRPRRLRKSPAVRALAQETHLHASELISPHFVIDGSQKREAIKSMPGICRKSIDELLKEIELEKKLGIGAVALFPVIDAAKKDEVASAAFDKQGILLRTIKAIKKEFPDTCVIADVALDPYTTHGHDGIVENGEVLNDKTVEILAKMALAQAEAGIDMVAPSDMMDGRVGAIRRTLEENGFSHVNILAYTAKYASSFYGPFRDALLSHPKFGDKKTYQMNPANRREALVEAMLDAAEGADILMVKPALPYLDVIVKMREMTSLPIAAYQVSGEYAMVMAADKEGWLDGKKALAESVLAIKRAGADMIFTYAAGQIAKMINDGALD